MYVIGLVFLAIVFYTLFDIFASLAGNNIDSTLSSVIFNGLGAAIPLLVYIYLQFTKKASLVHTGKNGIIYSILAGFCIALFSILLIKIFEKEGLAYVVPLIYGGSIVLAAFSGWLIFKESISAIQTIGIFLITLGISFIVISKLH